MGLKETDIKTNTVFPLACLAALSQTELSRAEPSRFALSSAVLLWGVELRRSGDGPAQG